MGVGGPSWFEVEIGTWVETLALGKAMQHHTPEWEERVVLALHRLSKCSRSLSAERYEENRPGKSCTARFISR